MLSIEQCRKFIPGGENLTDAQVEEIRAALYGFAELALDVLALENPVAKNPTRVSLASENPSSV